MKSFVTQIAAFIGILFVGLNVAGWILIETQSQGHAVENSRIYHCLAKSRRPWPQAEVFVFGDSVANQMYPPETQAGRINSLALVMPSTLAGQYFLLQRLAETNELEGKTIALVLSPGGFAGEFSSAATFHYVLKPFHNAEFAPWIDDAYRRRVPNSFVASLSQLPMIKCSNWSPPDWYPYLVKKSLRPPEALSPFAIHYLQQMHKLIQSEGGELKILPTIQPESERGLQYSELKARIQEAGLDDLFKDYFARFVYVEDEHFRDGAHVKSRAILGENILDL